MNDVPPKMITQGYPAGPRNSDNTYNPMQLGFEYFVAIMIGRRARVLPPCACQNTLAAIFCTENEETPGRFLSEVWGDAYAVPKVHHLPKSCRISLFVRLPLVCCEKAKSTSCRSS